jgi:hypothetical protein
MWDQADTPEWGPQWARARLSSVIPARIGSLSSDLVFFSNYDQVIAGRRVSFTWAKDKAGQDIATQICLENRK